MRLFILSFILLFCHAKGISQEVKPKLTGSDVQIGGTRSEMIKIPCSGFSNPQSLNLEFLPKMTYLVNEYRHGGPDKEKVSKIKAEKNELKSQFVVTNRGDVEVEATSAVVPEVGLNYNGNVFDGSYPADNNIAISPNGYVISVCNSNIIYAKNGVVEFYQSLEALIGQPSGWSACDPVVLFDPGASRYIMYMQECGVDIGNQISILFSKTANPHDGWWYYTFNGDPTGNNYFFDYPKIAISGNDLFLTANLFSQNSSEGAIILQMDKQTGYNGQFLNFVYYNNLLGHNFTLLPVSYGLFGTYGPGIYFVATDNSGGNSISFYDITDDVGNNPEILHSAVSTTNYSLPGDALQGGSNCKLDMGDCRALSGFYLDGIIHFVFHSDYGNGYGGINYNRLSVATKTNVSSMFGFVGYDYGYPAVASFGSSATDRSAMISFGRTSEDFNPQIRVVNVDHDMNWSNSTYIYEQWSVGCFQGEQVQRWGDYTGCCRNFNSSIPSVYVNGMFGNANGGWDTRIAEVHSGGSVAVQDVKSNISNINVYPNPGRERFNVTFTSPETMSVIVELVDLSGRVVYSLFQGVARQGANQFSFQPASLASGTYFVRIKNDHKILSNEKLVLVH